MKRVFSGSFIFFMTILLAGFVYGAIPVSEREALITLYNSTNGDSWNENYGWKTPPLHTDGFALPGTEGTWKGVTVSGDHVTEIGLGDNNLAGTIPPELENLPNLVNLYLYGNQLTGTIPPELGNLSSLISLYLRSNQLTGSIPPELGDLSNLKWLYLYSNQLTGSIPPELGNLSNLTVLQLSFNQLTGSIPPELGNLSSLTIFALYSNQLTGSIPPELGNLSNLIRLFFHSNRLTGSIPPELGNLSNLENLYLTSNRLTGSIPPELGNLSSLVNGWSNLRWNGLYTDNDTLRNFLNSKQSGGDWESSQTTAPEDVAAVSTGETSIRVSWTPIVYTGETGGYRVFYSTIPGGPYTWYDTSADKTVSQMDVLGLNPCTTYYFVVQTRTDPHADNENTVNSEYSAEVTGTTLPLLTLPAVTTTTVSGIAPTTAASGGNVTGDGCAAVTARGVCWSTSPNPTVADSHTTDGTGTGTFTSSITGLNPGTTYHVRAYATNSEGTSYGNDISFTTTTVTPGLPTVTTAAVSGITTTTASSGGNVTDDGGAAVTARGVCWGTSPNPTAAGSHTTNGTGTGTFTSSITGLNPDTTYHVRAYAANSAGTSYGNDVSFTTTTVTPGLPTVTTAAVSGITAATASSGGNVTNNGGAAITARGVCWSTSPNPTVAGSHTTDGAGTGAFTSNLTGLMEYTTYYLRAYATNSAGTSYGEELSFTTSAETISVSITEPLDGAVVSGTVTIKATATSGAASAKNASILAVSKLEFYIDNTKVAEYTSGPYEYNWDTTGAADGSHAIKAIAYNPAAQTSSDEITVNVLNVPPHISLNRTRLNYGADPEGRYTGSQYILVNNTGGGTLSWTADNDAEWLVYSPASGTGNGLVHVSVNPEGLAPGTYTTAISFEATDADNSPQTVEIYLKVYESVTSPPFGIFETPVHGSTVMSSIPVTGWVLDDIEVESVKVYRGDVGNLVYIGDAVFVEGARPGVEPLYPGYPKNYQAGWGYMLLTNYLPNQGNGTFTLYAKAVDKEGNEVTLGSKTITCDNANAVKPFGAIDTPAQGGTASGSGFFNQGWALTPQPNSIPTDGSTINVFVDGVNLGNLTYNIYRDDVAALFPGYANSSGAGGYFYLDTTAYTNGIHTISWTAEDDAGNADGIGSRYFTIQNSQGAGSRERGAWSREQGAGGAGSRGQGAGKRKNRGTLSGVPVDYENPIGVIKGFREDMAPQEMMPDDNGNIIIEIKELERVEIHFFKPYPDVEHRVFNVSPLPIGSTLNGEKGIFFWTPGVAFCGEYPFVFIEKGPHGELRKNIMIKILPRFCQ